MELCLAENTAEELMNVQLTRGTMSSENFTQVIKMGVKNGIAIYCGDLMQESRSIRRHSTVTPFFTPIFMTCVKFSEDIVPLVS